MKRCPVHLRRPSHGGIGVRGGGDVASDEVMNCAESRRYLLTPDRACV